MAEGRESQGNKSRSRCGDHTNKKEHEMCCFFEARHQELERRQQSAQRRSNALFFLLFARAQAMRRELRRRSFPPSPLRRALWRTRVAFACVALRSLRLRQKFDATWREGYAGISGMRRKYACNRLAVTRHHGQRRLSGRKPRTVPPEQRPKDGEGKRQQHYYCTLEPKEGCNHGRGRDSSEDRRDR